MEWTFAYAKGSRTETKANAELLLPLAPHRLLKKLSAEVCNNSSFVVNRQNNQPQLNAIATVQTKVRPTSRGPMIARAAG